MDSVRRTLCEVVGEHGAALVREPRRLENLLNDLCGEEKPRIFVLVHAARAGVPADLAPAAGRRVTALQIERSTRKLCHAYGFADETARWAVETWALALGAPGSGQPVTDAITVCAQGRGQFTSLAEAVRRAPPWSRIELLPGTYAESLLIDRPLEIVAAGRPGDVILAPGGGCGIRLDADYALVRGVAVRGASIPAPAGPTGKGAMLFAVDVPRGELLLEDCEVSAGELACVAVRGKAAIAVVRRCRIHGGRQAGIYVSLGAASTVTDCDIEANGGAGVEIGWQGSPVLRRCRVRGNGTYGIRIYAGGESAVEECDLTGNRLGAWSVEEE